MFATYLPDLSLVYSIPRLGKGEGFRRIMITYDLHLKLMSLINYLGRGVARKYLRNFMNSNL
jgi:hypothetical protein